MTEARDMLSDELVGAMELLHLYPRLIAERAAKEARRAALTALREKVAGMERWPCTGADYADVVKLAAILAEIDRALGD